MTETHPKRGPKSGSVLRIGVIAIGAVVFLLLLFADKTNLNTQSGRTLESGSSQAAPSPSGQLPPLAPDPELDAWIAELEQTEGPAKGVLLDSITRRLEIRNRYEYAAQYAEQLAQLDSSFENLQLAGRLYQEASHLDYVAQDSGLQRAFSKKAISFLEKASRLDEQNEEALYLLGLAYVESGDPQYSMQGILTIRKVLEINPDNTNASFSLGMFSIQTGQYDKAAQRFEKVLEKEPDNYAAKYYLTYSRIQLDDKQDVKALLEDVLKNASDSELKQMAKSLLNNI